jgi:hypothetical protein
MAMKPVKPRKTSQPKPPSLVQQFVTKRDKVAQNAIDSAFSAVGKVNKAGSKTTIKKGGPRPKMERTVQPAKPKTPGSSKSMRLDNTKPTSAAKPAILNNTKPKKPKVPRGR